MLSATRDIDCRKRTVEGCKVESRGHVSVQVGAGPYLRNKHPRGRIGRGPQGTGPLPTVGDLVPRDKPSKSRQGRSVRPVERRKFPKP